MPYIDHNKLWNYSLNSQHDRGKHKARLFAAILDLGRNENDVEILQTLIIEASQNFAPLGSSVPMKIFPVSLVVIS